jgi:hypothetical protein
MIITTQYTTPAIRSCHHYIREFLRVCCVKSSVCCREKIKTGLVFTTVIHYDVFLENAHPEKEMDTTTIQIERFGGITLPSDLQEKYGYKTGDSFQLLDFNGLLVFTPMTPTVIELAQEIEKIRQEAGMDMEELLQGLREQRSQNIKNNVGE